MRFFRKIYPSQPLILTNGKGFRFPIAESGVGLLATDNPVLIGEFEKAVAAKIGGVDEISQAEFEALKKKATPQRFNEGFSPSKLVQAKLAADEQAAAAGRAAERKIQPAQRGFQKPTPRMGGSGFRPGTIDRP